MKTISEIEIPEEHLKNEKYNFQPKLTPELDTITSDFDQEIINQIVLWKVNRYAEINDDTFSLLNTIKKENTNLDEDLTKKVLENFCQRKEYNLRWLRQFCDLKIQKFIKSSTKEFIDLFMVRSCQNILVLSNFR